MRNIALDLELRPTRRLFTDHVTLKGNLDSGFRKRGECVLLRFCAAHLHVKEKSENYAPQTATDPLSSNDLLSSSDQAWRPFEVA